MRALIRPAFTGLALASAVGAFGSLTWDTRLASFKPEPGAKQVEASFGFKNSGATTVEIRDIQTSCECTTADVVKRFYAPGESGTIKAVVNLGDRMGTMERIVTLRTESGITEFVNLTLHIELPELLKYSTRVLRWPVGTTAGAQSVEIQTIGGVKVAALEIRQAVPAEAAARVETVDAGNRYRVIVQPKNAERATTVSVDCRARFTDGREHNFTILALIR